MSKRTMMFGGYKFNKYFPNTKTKPFKKGGWSGVVLFIDKTTNDIVVGTTMHLARYLGNVNFDTIKRGRYGKKVSQMSHEYIDIFYHEIDLFGKLKDYKNHFAREMNKLKEERKQLELDFSKGKKNVGSSKKTKETKSGISRKSGK